MMTDDQSATAVFLANPASYGLAVPVERMETHISMIFLVGDRVYKLKKALKLPYVDFSTAAIREDACRKEVALNSETAPGLYIGVRRITRSGTGTLEFDGDGPLVDAVVEMSRFEQNQLFDQIAAAGRLTPGLMTQTARMIAFYHSREPVVSKGGGAANIEAVLDINDAGFATSHVFGRAELARSSESFRSRLVQHGELLDRRALAGKVRRCEMARHAELILAQGGSVVADAVFDDPVNRRLMEDASAKSGAGFRGIWLVADPELLWQRVRERAGGPSDATTDVLSGQLARKPTDINWRKFDASKAPEAISAAILKA
jgi:aminoglycoside phosphotransferase family enzyme